MGDILLFLTGCFEASLFLFSFNILLQTVQYSKFLPVISPSINIFIFILQVTFLLYDFSAFYIFYSKYAFVNLIVSCVAPTLEVMFFSFICFTYFMFCMFIWFTYVFFQFQVLSLLVSVSCHLCDYLHLPNVLHLRPVVFWLQPSPVIFVPFALTTLKHFTLVPHCWALNWSPHLRATLTHPG